MDRQDIQGIRAGYGVASAAITASGLLIVSTTKVAYHGISFLASTTNKVSILVYDIISNTTGNLLDIVLIQQGGDRQGERTIPVMAKNGITLGITGTGGRGVIFYGPRG